MEPIRMTLAGCSTVSYALPSSGPGAVGTGTSTMSGCWLSLDDIGCTSDRPNPGPAANLQARQGPNAILTSGSHLADGTQPDEASSGTYISSTVREPCRHTRRLSPVSAGSR